MKIDTVAPVPAALANVTVRKGKKATLRFKVADTTPTVVVTIKIYKGSKLKKKLALGSRPANVAQNYAWTCKLARGAYTWKVYATDLAGHAQVKPGSKRLTVK